MSETPSRRPWRRRSVSTGAAVALLGAGLAPLALAAPTSATPTPADEPVDLIISEYIEGSSSNKALEVFNGTGAEVDLTQYTLELYSNGNTTAGFTQALQGTLADGDAFVFAHNSLAQYADQTTGNGLWNGDDAIVLTKDGQVVDSLGRVGEQPPGGWSEGGVSTQNATLRRMAQVCAGDTDPFDAFDPSAQYEAFAIDTFDGLGEHAVSDCGEVPEPPDPEPVPDCGDAAMPIGEIQGSGAETPIPGETVSIEGTVVGDFQEGGFGGFYVQDAGDGDPATSDGIFVYHPSAPAVGLGDTVRVTGTAGEYFGMTQISATDTGVCETGGDLPEPIEILLPIEDHDEDLERYEGMRVTLPQSLAILEYYNYAQFGEITVGSERQFQPTGTFPPGSPEAIALDAANWQDRITLDDGRSAQNPDPALHPNGEEFTLENMFRGGDLVTDATGVLDYRFELWRVQPTQPAQFEAVNERPEAPVLDGDLTIGAFNVLNYFTTLGDRGADDEAEFERQEAKIVTAILEMDADVLGLVEIENNDDLAVNTLVAALNEEAGEERYAALQTGSIGTDAITTALIYQPETVAPVGEFALLDSSVDPTFLDDFNRPVLAQTFQAEAGGEPFTMAVNHLKSKGSDCDDVGDPIDPDGQGECNQVRTDAAEAMVPWLAGDPTGTGAEDVFIVGDLNSYDYEDPIVALQDGGYVDLLKEYVGEDAYTYVFDGQLGYLDYALASDSATDRVLDAAAWYANADEVSLIDYDMTFKKPAQQDIYAEDAYRASDHDAVLVGISASDEPVDPEPVIDRLPGDQRYDTARLVSELYPDGVDTVIVANGQDSGAGADALAAAPVAAGGFFGPDAPAAPAEGAAPVVLVQSDRIPDDTEEAIEALDPERIVVLGGTSAINQVVLDQLAEDGRTVERVTGDTRYDTAAALAGRMGAVERVYIAKGESDGGATLALADALTGGSLAGAEGAPVLLTKGGHLPQATREALADLGPVDIQVIGGESAVSGDVLTELEAYGTVTRVPGADRWETSVLLSGSYEAGAEHLYVASGQTFPDALTASALTASSGVPLLIVKQNAIPSVVLDEVGRLDPAAVTIVGGTDAVGTVVEELLADVLGAAPDAS